MKTITLSAILEDLQVADQTLRRFEQRYWLSSSQFYDLYARAPWMMASTARTSLSGQASISSNSSVNRHWNSYPRNGCVRANPARI